MPGFSITVLLLPHHTETDESVPDTELLLSLLDEKPAVPGWKWASATTPEPSSLQIKRTVSTAPAAAVGHVTKLGSEDPAAFIASVKRACGALIDAEPEITRMDNIAGDGDCGLTLKDGANGAESIPFGFLFRQYCC